MDGREEQKMAAVTHCEIFAEEPATLADYYRNLFGWQIEQSPGLRPKTAVPKTVVPAANRTPPRSGVTRRAWSP
jgi:predicted enzyme related to lactoylglutathione lyase